MINRKIYSYLEDFFALTNRALLLTGARQTGKTFSIREFCRRKFKSFVEINFVEMPDARDIFAQTYSSKDILARLSLFTQVDLIKNETIIFFDEVQECPEIVTAIKFLVDEGSYRYVLSGSLLGVELNDLRSVPVGYMGVKELFPLDFEEFLLAYGVSQEVLDLLQNAWTNRRPVDTVIHKKIMELFRLYLILGGMPAVVNEYISNNNLRSVMMLQADIINLYKQDIAKYDHKHKLLLEEIFNLIPPELNAKNKRFILKNLNEKSRFANYENSFLWLKNAGVALPVYNVDEPKAPLLLSRSRNLFKLFMNDVGLLASQYANGLQMRLLKGDEMINYGAIYENFVAQELQAHGFSLYYFNSKRQGEIDFVIEHDGTALPIEVKSGKDYKRHHALSNVLNTDDYGIKNAFVLCNDNISATDGIMYAPIYMTMFIKNDMLTTDTKYIIDISTLP